MYAASFVVCLIWSGDMRIDDFVVTCEHGGNTIPKAYRELFHKQEKLLNSHFGYDPGALAMARSLAAALNAPLLAATTSRLLIDLNRPPGHPHLFSCVTRTAPAELRAKIASQHYEPYWAELKSAVRRSVENGRRVIHVSSHSFTPELNGHVRRADIGLLYDPGRRGEAELCASWKAMLSEYAPRLRVRRNYPYRGRAAGLTAWMRRCFSADTYTGIELEVNQRIVFAAGRPWAELRSAVSRSLLAALPGGL